MIALIYGGSGSGKSAYAEELVLRFSQDGARYYLATMAVYGEEGRQKVERHRALRATKQFQTIEQTANVRLAAEQITKKPATVLLECMSNLVANEMFSEQGMVAWETVEEKIITEVTALAKGCEHLVIVTNNVFEDGTDYDEGTMAYIEALGRINRQLAEVSDVVVEVVAGIPLLQKGSI